EAGVGATHYRDAARLPDALGQPVRLRRGGGDGRDGHQVGGQDLVHVDGVDVLDVDADVVSLVAHDGGQQDRSEARNAHAAVDVEVRRLRLDKHELPQHPLHLVALLRVEARTSRARVAGTRYLAPLALSTKGAGQNLAMTLPLG